MPGRLFFSPAKQPLLGKTELLLKDWHHVALVHEGTRVPVYLDGQSEMTGERVARTQGQRFILAATRRWLHVRRSSMKPPFSIAP